MESSTILCDPLYFIKYIQNVCLVKQNKMNKELYMEDENDDGIELRLENIEEKLNELLDKEESTAKFKIETTDDSEFYMYFNGKNSYFALYDLDQYLRNTIKHGGEDENLDLDLLQHCRDKLHECMEDNGVDFEHVN